MRLLDKDQAPLLAQPFYDGGTPGPIIRSLAHVPELLEVTAPFLGAMYGDSAVAPRLKEIAILRTSALRSCQYCVQTHSVVSLSAGLTREEIVCLRDPTGKGGGFVDERERTLVNWTDAMAGGSGPIDDETTTAFYAQFSEAEVVELSMLIGATLMLNRYCTAMSLQASPSTLEELERQDLL